VYGTPDYNYVCCSVLQCVTVCCSVMQCVAMCCSVLQCVAVCVVVCCVLLRALRGVVCGTLDYMYVCRSVLRVLQCVAVCCSVL